MTTELAQISQDQIGAAMRQRRKAMGKTLVDIAQETGLTIGFISQIERGLSAPSLTSFMRIAGALGTSVEQLLSVPEAYQPFQAQDQRQTYSLGDAGRYYEKLGPGFSGALFYPCIIHRPANHVSERMQHEGEVFCYLLAGRLRYHLSDQIYEMKAGDSIHHDTRHPHYSEVIGEGGSTELWVSSTPLKNPAPTV